MKKSKKKLTVGIILGDNNPHINTNICVSKMWSVPHSSKSGQMKSKDFKAVYPFVFQASN